MLKAQLESKKCFKLVCGAGNEEVEEIRRLIYLYAIAGCRFFDLSANIEVVDAAKKVLSDLNIDDACLCISVGIKSDPHLNKAVIDHNKCVNCGSCETVCIQNAIHDGIVKKSKCVGCGRCWKVCPRAAISYIPEEKKLDVVLPEIIAKGIDCIEFHVIGQDETEIFTKWRYINDNFGGMLSICTSRGKLGDEDLIDRITKMTENRSPYTTIIQADGFPMSGGEDSYKSTLQAVATAQIVENAKLPVYIMLSGGTNGKTTELANLCDIDYNGVAVGSYARKIIRSYIEQPEFWDNPRILMEALEIIKPLVNNVLMK